MENNANCSGLVRWITLFTLLSFVQARGVVVIDVSNPVARVQEDVTISCHVISDGSSPYFVEWFKRVGRQEEMIAVNKRVNRPFAQTGRYSADITFKTPGNINDVMFTLTIGDVQEWDSGVFGCRIGGGPEDSASLTVHQ